MGFFVDLLSRLAFLYAGVVSGYLIARSPFFKPRIRKQSYAFVIWFVAPALIIGSLLTIGTDASASDYVFPILASLATTISGYVAIRILYRFKEETHATKSALESLAAFPNSLNFPFPVILAFAGTAGLVPATLFLLGQLILRNTLGVWTNAPRERDGIDSREILRKILLFPPVFSVAIGFVLWLFLGPQSLNENQLYTLVQKALIFAMVMTIGFDLELGLLRQVTSGPIRKVILSRFGGGFVVGLGILFFPLPSYVRIALFVQAVAPPAVANQVYAEYFELDTKITSTGIVVLTFIALLILPLELFILLEFV